MDDYITASEVASYLYCHRAWWLKNTGYSVPATVIMERGAREHTNLAVEVRQIEQRRRLGWRIVVIGLLLLVALITLKFATGA